MQYDNFFAGMYQIEKILEHATYSVLGIGKKSQTGQPVMIRLWLTAHAATVEAQERIQAEVAALQAIQHLHLLPLLEVHASAQGAFLVSEYAPAGSLNERLQQQSLRLLLFADALRIIQQAGQALHTLHQQGITHGHLTPQAIFFTTSEDVLLGDFRVNSILESIQDYQPTFVENVQQYLYMAPEQFYGVESTASDQYALGCLAYRLLTGQVPFAGSARATLLQKHQRDQPKPLTEINPALPAYIEAVILKALSKQPTERYESVQAFLEALEGSPRSELADQITLAPLPGSIFAEQETFQQLTPASEAPTLTMSALETSPPSSEPVTAATWSRNRNSVAAPTLPVKPVVSRHRQTARQATKARGVVVVFAMSLLVLAIVLAAGGWSFFSSGHTQPHHSAGQTAATSVLTTPTSAQITATANAVQGSLSPTSTPTISLSPTTTPSPTATSTSGGGIAVTPFVDCVTSNGSNLVAQFGYVNKGTSTVNIAPGGNNAISPANLDGPQPGSFLPGYHHDVFQITFFKHQSVTWSLNGTTTTASNNSPQC